MLRIKTVSLPNSIQLSGCKLGAHIKKRMKRKNASYRGVKVVFSTEIQQPHSLNMTDGTRFKKSFYGTVSYMPALFGLLGAAEVLRFLGKKKS